MDSDSAVLHAVRLRGMATEVEIAGRCGRDLDAVEESLLDSQARGWLEHTTFFDSAGWSLTDAGRLENERRLAAEVAPFRSAVVAAHEQFLPLNARMLKALTDWQIRPLPGEPMAMNDHTDWRWDDRVLDEVTALVRKAEPLCVDLTHLLSRFETYAPRLQQAVDRIEAGERSWVDRPRAESVHTVWFELHEDLIATLGLSR